MKFCPSCDSPYEEGTVYCGHCGTRLTQQAEVPSAAAQAVVNSQAQGKVHCPNRQCRSKKLSPVVETSVNTTSTGGGYSGAKGCLGYLLFGPCGLLCGSCGQTKTTTTNTTNRTYWVCQDCGKKFRNLEDLEEEITKKEKMTPVLIGASVLLAVCLIILWVVASKVSATGIAVFATIFVVAILVTSAVSHFPKLNALKQEREELLRDCFD